MDSKPAPYALVAALALTLGAAATAHADVNAPQSFTCTASDGMNAVQLVAIHQPDLALLDFRMPRLNGLQAAQELRRAHPSLRVIIYSEIQGTTLEEECRNHGADGYVSKGRLPDGLLHEIRRLFPDAVL